MELPEVTFINEKAFYNSPITHLQLGSKLNYVYNKAFEGIEGTLKELRIAVKTPSQLRSKFSKDMIKPTGARLLVPTGSLADWKAEFPWLETTFLGGIAEY